MLEEIQESFSNLNNLQESILFTKKLKYLPISLFRNKKLNRLIINSENIKVIPESISELKNLEEIIFLNDCKNLKSISELNLVKSLKSILLRGFENPEILVSQTIKRESLEILY